jgi:hypothetical protein
VRATSFTVVWRTLALSVPLLLGPSLILGQQEESKKPSKAKVTAKKETTQVTQIAAPKQDKEREKREPEEKPKELLEEWVEQLPYRVLPPLGIWVVEPSGPWFYSLADVFLDRVNFKPPPSPYGRFGLFARPYFDVSLEYLKAKSKATEPISVFDFMHPLCAGDNWLLSTGGEFRWRYMDQFNTPLLNNKANTYDLFRERFYADLWITPAFRIYAEFLSAQTRFQDAPPVPGNQNLTTLLNAFVEAKGGEIAGAPVYARFGRQELLFGSQRLISPLPWINTLRTFDGVRLYRASAKFDFDAFWVQPAFPNSPSATATFLDPNRSFAGAWATYRPNTDTFIDAYYLFLDNVPTPDHNFLGPTPPSVDTVHTLGSAYRGKKEGFLWDIEQMFQTGQYNNRTILADATTVGGGYHFANVLFHPTLWGYYDYASGSQNPTGGRYYTTFNQLFPFSHYYLGWLDLVARQNIQDFNAHLYLYPTKWTRFWLQYHHFELANPHDALYNANGTPIARDPTGTAGSNVGDELEFIVNFHLLSTSDLMMGYSHLFPGLFLLRTGTREPADQVFVQYSLRF